MAELRPSGFPEYSPSQQLVFDKLKRIMNAYDRYANCEITIEVKEDDYLDTPYNLIKTKEALETIGYKDLKI